MLARTVAPESSKGPALIAVMMHYTWQKAAILMSTDEVYFHSGQSLARQLDDAGMQA